MDKDTFERELEASGYTQIEAKAIDPRPANTEHGHDYGIRGLVVDGIFIVIRNGIPTTFRSGQVFDVPAGVAHCEEIGEGGARIIVGRKY
jgi:quercetin dioxygenase-like cupin family protein